MKARFANKNHTTTIAYGLASARVFKQENFDSRTIVVIQEVGINFYNHRLIQLFQVLTRHFIG